MVTDVPRVQAVDHPLPFPDRYAVLQHARGAEFVKQRHNAVRVPFDQNKVRAARRQNDLVQTVDNVAADELLIRRADQAPLGLVGRSGNAAQVDALTRNAAELKNVRLQPRAQLVGHCRAEGQCRRRSQVQQAEGIIPDRVSDCVQQQSVSASLRQGKRSEIAAVINLPDRRSTG